jgi:hypothetical protein
MEVAKTRQMLSAEYGICPKTLNRRLKKVHIKIESGVILPRTLNKIYKALGNPKSLK